MNTETIRLGAMAMAASIAALAVASPALAPEERTLTPLKVEMREGKGPAYKVVATAKQGEKVMVTKTEDKWLLLERGAAAGGQKGWVHANALAVAAGKRDGANALNALSGRSDRTEVTAAAAAKGIQPQTYLYAGTRGFDIAALVELQRRRDSVGADELAAFMRALRQGGK